MSFKLLVVFAMIGMAVAASLSDKDQLLYEQQLFLENKLLTKEEQVEPETMKKVVVELVKNVYPKRLATEFTGNQTRNIASMLFCASFLDSRICPELEDYNGLVEAMSIRFSYLPNVVNMLKFYQEQQNQMCQ